MRRQRWIIPKWLKANGKGKCLKAKANEVPKHVRKAKATESLQKAHRKRREIRKGKSLWRARFLAGEKFQQQNLRLPVRNKRATKYEQRLANWLDRAKQRRDRALSSRPSERLLTPTEAVQLKELFDVQESITGCARKDYWYTRQDYWYTKLKTTFQQYKDANTNWKDILLAYRADKIKEWNQAADVNHYGSQGW